MQFLFLAKKKKKKKKKKKEREDSACGRGRVLGGKWFIVSFYIFFKMEKEKPCKKAKIWFHTKY